MLKKKVLILISVFVIICTLLVACKSTKEDGAYSGEDNEYSSSEQVEENDGEDNDIDDYSKEEDSPSNKNKSTNKKTNKKKSEKVTYTTTKPIPTKEKDFVIYDNGTTTIIHKTVYDTTATTQKEGETITEDPNDLPPDWN